MKIGQALKMALRSIMGNKGRSVLTMLGIIIGIASVMVIVSTINGMNRKSLEQFEAMGTNRINVRVYSYEYDKDGNPINKDYFDDLYDYCLTISLLNAKTLGFAVASVLCRTNTFFMSEEL